MSNCNLSASSTGDLPEQILYSNETEESLLADFERRHNIFTKKIIEVISLPPESFGNRFDISNGRSKSVSTKAPSKYEIARRNGIAAGYHYFDQLRQGPFHPVMASILNHAETEKLANELLDKAAAHESDVLQEMQQEQKLRGIVASTIQWGMINGGMKCIDATRENKTALLEEIRMCREIRNIVSSFLTAPQPG